MMFWISDSVDSSKMSILNERIFEKSFGDIEVVFELYSVDTVCILSGIKGNLKFIRSFR